MAEWHLKELRVALENKGWHLLAELPGNDHNVSAYWQLQRSPKEPSVIIAFEGLDELRVLPLNEAYACHVVGQEAATLYFKKRSRYDRERHYTWQKELADFVALLTSY